MSVPCNGDGSLLCAVSSEVSGPGPWKTRGRLLPLIIVGDLPLRSDSKEENVGVILTLGYKTLDTKTYCLFESH